MSKVYIAEYAGTAYTPQGDTATQLAAPTVAEQKLDTATTTGAIVVLGAITAGSAGAATIGCSRSSSPTICGCEEALSGSSRDSLMAVRETNFIGSLLQKAHRVNQPGPVVGVAGADG